MAEEEIINEQELNLYKILDASLILNFEVIKFLIAKKDWDALILICIYAYISKLQRNTTKIWASNEFVRKIWGVRKTKVLKTKSRLQNEYQLIKLEPLKDKETKKIIKWVIWIKPLLNPDLVIKKARGSQDEKARGSQKPLVGNGNHSSIEYSISSIEDIYASSSKNKLSSSKQENTSTPPKSSSPSKEPWTKEMLQWLEEKQGAKFANYGKQLKALGNLKKAGYTPEQIKDCYEKMIKDKFWKERLPDFVNIANNITKYIKKVDKYKLIEEQLKRKI